jgi:hypothetical protein
MIAILENIFAVMVIAGSLFGFVLLVAFVVGGLEKLGEKMKKGRGDDE